MRGRLYFLRVRGGSLDLFAILVLVMYNLIHYNLEEG